MRRYQVTVGGQEHVVDVQELSANEFRVVVAGQELEVTLSGAEELTETLISPEMVPARTSGAQAPPSADAFRPARPETLPPLVASSPPPLPTTTDSASSNVVKAPMPGAITAVAVTPGDTVVSGQVLVKLEAMKMVNAIKSPRAATVATVGVQPGDSVGYGHVLVTFEDA